jgi:hypothetical protein
MTDNKNIKKGAPKQNPVCYQVLQDIVIPAGTIMRRAANERGGSGYVECMVGHGINCASNLVVQIHADAESSGFFKKVIAA